MPLQGFVDKQLPTIKAAWLNAIDVFYVTLFNSATTAAQARTAISAAQSGTNTDITSLAAPALGAASATTQLGTDNTTKVATTAQVQLAIAAAALTGTYSSTFTFNGSGGTSGALTIAWQKIGNVVTLHIPNLNAATGTNSSALTSNTVAPAGIRPPSNVQNCCVSSVYNNGAVVAVVGLMTMDTTGKISVFRDATGANWTNTAAGGLADQTFTYYLG